MENYLVLQPIFRYFKRAANTNKITRWKLKGLSDDSIKPPLTSDNNLTLGVNYIDHAKMRLKFDGRCLKQEKFTFA